MPLPTEMSTEPTGFTLVDPDRYVEVERFPVAREYAPTVALPGWVRSEQGVWTTWCPLQVDLPDAGWKVHVSAQLARTQHVLDVVAEVCGRRGVPFKHVRAEWFFLWLHHKHGDRLQSGKFCTAYPRTAADAEELMTELAARLAGEEGPGVLTDRPFRGSRVVSYRYGAFRGLYRLRSDGRKELVLHDGDGSVVPDRRRPGFTLPEGVTDPFTGPEIPAQRSRHVVIGGYTFRAALRHTNGGGAYRASGPDGRQVFVKEARPHNGYQWNGSSAVERLRHERDVLAALHRAAPGVAPELVDYFAHDGHEFLVTEWVPGQSLWSWNATHNPGAHTDDRLDRHVEFYRRCDRVLEALQRTLDRLHEAGYVFGDLNPDNVLIDAEDHPRLIDFEVASRRDAPVALHGAPGFFPVDSPAHAGLEHVDAYGLAALAQTLLHPLHAVLDRNPAALDHLRAEIPAAPSDLWRKAALFRVRKPSLIPTPEAVAEDAEHWLGWLRDRTVEGILRSADVGAERPFLTVPEGLVTNPFSVSFGTAGVLHALSRAQVPLDERLVTTLLNGARNAASELPPGLLTGSSGVAWVLADLGRVGAARELLDDAARHPLLDRDPTLAHGRAGVVLALLHLERLTRDPGLVETACRLADPLLRPSSAVELPAMTGWRLGRPGLSLALHRLAQRTHDSAMRARALDLLAADLRLAHPVGNGGVLFQVSERDRRVEPYVACGSAGFALVAGRILDDDAPQELWDAYRGSLRAVRGGGISLLSALFEGVSGLGLVLSELADLTGEPRLHDDALRLGRSLFKYAVPATDGTVRFLGGTGQRMSDDLAYGAAGVVLFLTQVINRAGDNLFTLDAHAGQV